MNRNPFQLLQHVASAPSSLDIMMSDDDSSSRDSGVSMTMDEDMEVNFSQLLAQETRQIESMEIDDHPAASSENVAPGVSTVSMKRSFTLRRQKSACQVRLFGEKKTTPVITFGLAIRPTNQQDGQGSEVPSGRKRMTAPDIDVDEARNFKRRAVQAVRAIDQAYKHYHTEGIDADDDDDYTLKNVPEDLFIDKIYMDVTAPAQPAKDSEFAKPRHPPRWKGKIAGLTYHRSVNGDARTVVDRLHEEMEANLKGDELNHVDKFHLTVEYHLGSVRTNSSSCFRRITAELLTQVLTSLSDEEFTKKYVLIDCRYPFEYNGGHIKHAINFYDQERITELFYNDDDTPKHQRVPIFYCEYSQKRGPSMANALREFDRKLNYSKYPHVSFAEMYVLDKGYREFYRESRRSQEKLCVPDAYIEMNCATYSEELKEFPFHKSKLPGQSVFRTNSAPENLMSSRNSRQSTSTAAPPATIAEEGEEQPGNSKSPENVSAPPNRGLVATPAPRVFSKHSSRRNLFSGNASESPTTKIFQVSIRQQQRQQRDGEEEGEGAKDAFEETVVVAAEEDGSENMPPTPPARVQFDQLSPPSS